MTNEHDPSAIATIPPSVSNLLSITTTETERITRSEFLTAQSKVVSSMATRGYRTAAATSAIIENNKPLVQQKIREVVAEIMRRYYEVIPHQTSPESRETKETSSK
jgi:hypothetical protein